MVSVGASEDGWASQQSYDTEDDEPASSLPASLKARPPPVQEGEEPEDQGGEEENPILAESYARLARAAGATPQRDRWHDWFKLQGEWLSHVEQDPDNYFDDLL